MMESDLDVRKSRENRRSRLPEQADAARVLPNPAPAEAGEHPRCHAGGLRVVVLGAGYGGLTAALRLARRLKKCIPEGGHAELVLVDQHPYHLLETRLHEAATRGVEVTVPIRRLIRGRRIRFVCSEILGVDLLERRIRTRAEELRYDVLVIALGSKSAFYGIPGLEANAFTLKTLDDALSLRLHLERKVAESFEKPAGPDRARLRRVAVIGGGLTGVELATELADRVAALGVATNGADNGGVVVLEAGDRLLPGGDAVLARRVAGMLRAKGIGIRTGARVEAVEPGRVRLAGGDVLEVGTIVWTGGVRVVELLERSGALTGRQGRVRVDDTLQVSGFPGVYAIGDAALATDPGTGEPVPMSAQFALQQGRHAADNIAARLDGRAPRRYRPRVLGEVVSLGRHLAAASLALGWVGRLRLAGFFVSLLKRAIAEKHLMLLRKERAAWVLHRSP